MDKKKFWNLIYGLILLVTVTAEILAILAVKRLNMLPDAYMAVFIGVLALFALGIGLLLFLKEYLCKTSFFRWSFRLKLNEILPFLHLYNLKKRFQKQKIAKGK